MRLAVWFGFLTALATISLPVHAQVPERSPSSGDSLLIYAIGLVHSRPLQEPAMGHGMYLGNGALITAAHVMGRWPAVHCKSARNNCWSRTSRQDHQEGFTRNDRLGTSFGGGMQNCR